MLTSFKNESEEILNQINQEFENKFYYNLLSMIDADLIDGLSIEEIRKNISLLGVKLNMK